VPFPANTQKDQADRLEFLILPNEGGFYSYAVARINLRNQSGV
jgi:hypothetical protein